MLRHLLRFGVMSCLLIAVTGPAPAVDPPPAAPVPPVAAPADDAHRGDDYRQFFKKPETTAEFWDALQYEIEVGRFDLASGLLHSLLAKSPTEAELLSLENKYGMATFLSLHTVPKWSDDPKTEEQARKDATQLIGLVRDAVKKKLGDPKIIEAYVKNLTGEPDVHDYALKQLYRSGGQVVPSIIDALLKASPEDRLPLLDALRRLGPETLPPLYAVLDSDIPNLQLDILEILRKRGAVDAVPYLWRLTGPAQPDVVRRRATRVLADFLRVDETNLLPAKVALTREAERYYQHKVPFADPAAVVIWRWDDATKQLVRGWPGAETVSKDKAEEYYGIRFAKQALALDPAYTPAQNVLMSLALEKGAVPAGPPGKEAPSVRELISTVNSDLILSVLERALDDRRPAVILPAVKALGEMDDVHAGRPGEHGESALERALNYPDRRVQMAAADAILRIPGVPAGPTAGRMVEVWRRALAADPAAGKAAPKVIVGYFSEAIGNQVADAVKKAGFDPIQVRGGRDVLKRLNQAADVDLVLIDEALPDPGLPSLLAQLRADVHFGRTPVVLTVTQDREDAVRRFAERSPNVSVLPFALALNPADLKPFLQGRLDEAGPPLSEGELKEYAEKAVHRLAEVMKSSPSIFDVRPAAETVYAALRTGALSPEGQIDAIHLVGRLPGTTPQSELADVVLDDKRKPPVRVEAAAALLRHVQEHGLTLQGAHIDSLSALYAAGADKELKEELALLMGGMHPGPRLTGERLLNYQPTPPGPPPAPPAPPTPPPAPPPAPPKDK